MNTYKYRAWLYLEDQNSPNEGIEEEFHANDIRDAEEKAWQRAAKGLSAGRRHSITMEHVWLVTDEHKAG